MRKLGNLIDHLPPESATLTALRLAAPEPEPGAEDGEPPDASEGRWSALEMLMATAVDELRALRWQHGAVHGSKGSPPSPLRRPGAAPRRHGRLTMEQRRLLDPRLRVVEDPESA